MLTYFATHCASVWIRSWSTLDLGLPVKHSSIIQPSPLQPYCLLRTTFILWISVLFNDGCSAYGFRGAMYNTLLANLVALHKVATWLVVHSFLGTSQHSHLEVSWHLRTVIGIPWLGEVIGTPRFVQKSFLCEITMYMYLYTWSFYIWSKNTILECQWHPCFLYHYEQHHLRSLQHPPDGGFNTWSEKWWHMNISSI